VELIRGSEITNLPSNYGENRKISKCLLETCTVSFIKNVHLDITGHLHPIDRCCSVGSVDNTGNDEDGMVLFWEGVLMNLPVGWIIRTFKLGLKRPAVLVTALLFQCSIAGR